MGGGDVDIFAGAIVGIIDAAIFTARLMWVFMILSIILGITLLSIGLWFLYTWMIT